MASISRVTGVILSAEHRSGTSRTGNAYDFHTARVLVGTYGTTEVRVRNLSDVGGQLLSKGEAVDFVCEVDSFNGNVSFNAVGVFDPNSVVELV